MLKYLNLSGSYLSLDSENFLLYQKGVRKVPDLLLMEETIPPDLHFSKVSGISLMSPDRNITRRKSSPDRNVPRRKSSIFNRRNSFLDVNEKMQCGGLSRDPDFNVEMYIKCLKKEVADWEIMYKERKKERSLVKKRYRSVLADEDVFGIFNEEDKKFIEGRQNYNGLGQEAVLAMEKLSISLQKAIDAEKSSQLLINYVQKTETELRKKIVEFSILE